MTDQIVMPRTRGAFRTLLVPRAGAELAYLLRHDPEFRAVRREHLREVGKHVRLKEDLKIFVRALRDHLSVRFRFCEFPRRHAK